MVNKKSLIPMIYLRDWFSQQISNLLITAAIRFHQNVIAFPKLESLCVNITT